MRKIYTQEKFSFSIFEDDKLINILRDKYKITFTLEDDESNSEEKILTIDLSELEYISSGNNGSVFGLDNEKSVLKLTDNIDEINYYNYLYDIYKGDKSILYFVKIPEIYKVFNVDSKSFHYLCFMDRLNELDSRYEEIFYSTALQDINDFDEFFDSTINRSDNFTEDEKEKIIAFVYNVNELCVNYGFYDAHIENIMEDDDGNLFVIDLMTKA